MKDWEYEEIFEVINEDYNEYLTLNRGYKDAIARTFNEYINLGKIEDFIVDTAIGEILITHDKVFIGYVEGISKRLSMFNPKEAEGELTEEEINDLLQRINRVMDGLKNAEIDYNPSAEKN
ncbi:Imm3 family immunity protein [Metabacillus fastidiosus]|uniref:Imm3 family immunity protein n=1 Tax=Metabacillus fastidiosus TaxID=1458 RepID=UPI002E1B42E3|nr:Imm3 family immunity protein [Metabacillus fastidiosus]